MGKRTFDIDWLVFIPTVILVCLGLAVLLSIDASFFYQQILSAVIGLALFLLFARIDFSIYHYIDRWLFIGCIVFLLLSYLGPNVRGATRWLDLGPFRFQPSEFVKPFFLLSISSFMIRYRPEKIKHILLHIGLFLIIFLLIFKQPDLGSSLVYLAMWVGLIVLAGIPLRYIIGTVLTISIATPAGFKLLHDYQKLRILTFLNPVLDPQGAGYNAIQSMIAVGSGKLFGRGFGRGTQSILQFLPERHTDFVFASFTESFGFVGAAVLLAVFFILFTHLLTQANERKVNQVAFLYISGFFIQLFTHVVINIGMNMGILPITGITLPFISYGRSSFLAICIGLGIYISAIQRPRSFE